MAADEMRQGPTVQIDFAVHEVHRAGHEGAQQQDQQHPVLERDVDRQREQVEADVLAEQRIVLAVRHLVDEPEDQVPLAGLAHRDQQSDDERDGQDEQTPRQQRGHKSKQLGRRPGQCPDCREARVERRRKPKPSLRGKPQCQRSVHPEQQGRDREDGHEENGFRGEHRPEDADIPDRREPRPIDHEAAGAPQLRGDHDDGDRHANASPGHVLSPAARSTRRPPCLAAVVRFLDRECYRATLDLALRCIRRHTACDSREGQDAA